MNANNEHKTVTSGMGGLQETPWQPSAIIDLIRAAPAGCFDSALLAYSWNLFSQDGWPVLEECARHNIRVHVAGIWSGLHHTNAGGAGVPEAALREGQARMAGWATLASEHGCAIEAVAVAFAALPRVVEMVVIGMKTAGEVAANLAAAAGAGSVPSAIWREAQERGLLPAHLPLPH
jgi:D-threo-aldose 1-dehydrogenase